MGGSARAPLSRLVGRVAWLFFCALCAPCLVGAGVFGTVAKANASPAQPAVPVVPVGKGATYVFDGSSPLNSKEIGPLYAITCPTATLCYAVGETPEHASANLDGGPIALLVTIERLAGHWVISKATSDWPNVAYLDAISCTGALRCVAVGEGTEGIPIVEATTDANRGTWDEPRMPASNPALRLYGVSCWRAGGCVAVGYKTVGSGQKMRYVPGVWATAGSGDLANEAWVAAPAPKGYSGVLDSVDCPTQGDCWATGNWALHSRDGGQTWARADIATAPPGCKSNNCYVPMFDLLDTVDFVSSRVGLVAGGQQCGAGQTFSCPGSVLATSDGGKHWSSLAYGNIPFVESLSCRTAAMRCMGTSQEYSGYRSTKKGALATSTGVVAAATVSGSHTGTWSVGPWRQGLDYNAVACPPRGADCMSSGSFVSGPNRGLGGVFVVQGTTGAPAGAPHGRTSSISYTVPTPTSSLGNIGSDVAGAAITLGVALFITFPANVFNETFEQNYGDIAAWWSRWAVLLFPIDLRRHLREPARRLRTALQARSGGGPRPHETGDQGAPAHEVEGGGRQREAQRFGAVLALGALLGALLDPAFGFNVRTVLAYLAIALAMLAGVAVTAFTTLGYHRARKWASTPYELEALPAGLVVAAFCVLVSRAAGFSPGYLYGVICGVHFSRQLGRQEQGHLVALDALCKVVVALGAWLAWDTVTNHARTPGGAVSAVLLKDFLAALFVSSLVSTVVGLLPLRFMPGHKLRSWHQGAWAGVFLVSLFVLVQVLLRPHGTTGQGNTPLVTTIVLFVVFGAASLLFREHFARKHRTAEAAPRGPSNDVSSDSPAAVGEHSNASDQAPVGAELDEPSGPNLYT